jgi:hypothetical protein
MKRRHGENAARGLFEVYTTAGIARSLLIVIETHAGALWKRE